MTRNRNNVQFVITARHVERGREERAALFQRARCNSQQHLAQLFKIQMYLQTCLVEFDFGRLQELHEMQFNVEHRTRARRKMKGGGGTGKGNKQTQ